MSNISHSYLSLGPDYYLDVTVDQVKNARLVLFNRELADELHMRLPESDGKLEKYILEQFAWFKFDDNGDDRLKTGRQKTFFATRYLDSDFKSAGEAMGDGRAVWVDEIIQELDSGHFRYLDVVLKGTGTTPLAWLNHPKTSHKDGQLSLTEAVHEYIYSYAARRNGIDTVGALAVIELPFQRAVDRDNAAIIVRVGNHLRFAHYRYFSDHPQQLAKIFSYGLKRDLGFPLDYAVKTGDVQNYLDFVARNLARNAAIYFDTHAVHGSPTFGNKTSCGRSIDMGTFVYLDAHHASYNYMSNGANFLGGEWGQSDQFFNLFSLLLDGLKKSGFEYTHEIRPIEHYLRQFYAIFEEVLTQRWLLRMGLSENDIFALPADVKERFYEVVKTLYEAKGRKKISFKTGRFFLAAFEPRAILAKTAKNIVHLDNLFLLWNDLFKVKRHWQTYRITDAKPFITLYIKVIKEILKSLNATDESIQSWIERSNVIALSERIEPGHDFFYDGERFLVSDDIVRMIKQGESSWRDISAAAEQASRKFVDCFSLLSSASN